MTRTFLLALAAATLPAAAALALPAVGDIVGTNPEAATAALKSAGCNVLEFEAEDGQIEAKCIDTASNEHLEIYIDPKTGAVTQIKKDD